MDLNKWKGGGVKGRYTENERAQITKSCKLASSVKGKGVKQMGAKQAYGHIGTV